MVPVQMYSLLLQVLQLELYFATVVWLSVLVCLRILKTQIKQK